MSVSIIRLPSCHSTSAELGLMADAAAGTVVVTDCQTAGRGQRGNSWESEPGKNLTFSVLLRPENIPAARQFELSMIVALAVADTVDYALGLAGSPLRAKVKWPNDIYVGNKKISGILIENTLSGCGIVRSIAGIGLNVNQSAFHSDAPNPVSLYMLTNNEFELAELLDKLTMDIMSAVENYTGDSAELMIRYRGRLWRGEGEWPFREPDGTEFSASIESIAPDGILTLSNGKSYAFKEVTFVL